MSHNAQIITLELSPLLKARLSTSFLRADVPAGSIVVVGKLVGIAKFGISAGSRGSITVRGVFDVVKDPTTNIPAGTILYWSQISWHVVKNAYAHPMMGKAIEAAPPGTLTVRLRLSQ